MGAQVQERHPPGQHGVHEQPGRHAEPVQAAPRSGEEVAAADPVDDHADLGAPVLRRLQRRAEGLAGPVVAKDVARQGDAAPRLPDRCQHRRVGLVAVAVARDAVARHRRQAGDRLHRPVEGTVGLGHVGGGLRRVVELLRGPPLQPAGAPLDPVDAEGEVEQRAEDGREPGEPDPADGRAHHALAQQHVDADPEREHEADGRDDLGANGARRAEPSDEGFFHRSACRPVCCPGPDGAGRVEGRNRPSRPRRTGGSPQFHGPC